MLIIREFKLDDSEAIYQLNKNEMKYDYPLEETVENLKKISENKLDKIFVAEVDEYVIGYVHASNYQCIYSKPMKNILGIAVSKKFQKIGIGRDLLEAVEKWARDEKVSCVRLASGEEREDSHKFYLKCGYKKIKDQKNFRKNLIF
ncbi:GNAT family N-acetyltransferase [Miniphocaeibacter halophilus]|uniref:GNAT family N-acetyltransferase n=1 Tax=Miniphocaeibacter halophilus TaxID=2931922 RepID=A0AC61MMK4_9FIRM|nr:GNAT family N-acetyltransferase [Miniphocaeibacter halophilus]QQK06927.1 GNAT family N-acetyltransferase [Miniphocaeibacter halophilus]